MSTEGFIPVKFRTVLMIKDSTFGLLGIREFNEVAQVIRSDPREEIPAVQTYTDQKDARYWFNKSVATSKENGWTVIHDGQPLFG